MKSKSLTTRRRHLPLVDVRVDTRAELFALVIGSGLKVVEALVVALGIDAVGDKHVLGIRDGSTGNAAVGKGLLTNLTSAAREVIVRSWWRSDAMNNSG